jgi:hypothetical protein
MASYTATVKGTQKLYGFYGNGNGATYTITVTNGTGVMKKFDVIRRPIRGGIPNVVQTGYSGTAVTYTENARFDFELEIWADVTTVGTFTITNSSSAGGDNITMATIVTDSNGKTVGIAGGDGKIFTTAYYSPSGDVTGVTDPLKIEELFNSYSVVSLVSNGVYYGNLTLRNNNFLQCDGQAMATIVGTRNDVPVISRTGLTGISGLNIRSGTFTGNDLAPNSIGVSFSTSQNTSYTRDCYIHDVSVCLYSNESYVYSNVFENLQLGRFREAAIYFNCIGATGNLYNNIYAQDWSSYPTSKMELSGSVYQFLGSHDEGVMNQVNAEHVIANGVFLFNGCNNFKVVSCHIEGFEATGNFGALVNIVNSNVSIDTMTAVFCTIDAARAANYALVKFTVSGGIKSSLSLASYKDKGWTIVGSPTRNRFYRGGTTSETPDPIVWVNRYESPVFGGGDFLPQNGNDPQVQYGSGLVVAASAWNGSKLLAMGVCRLWVDASGRLRIKSGTPLSDADGTIVGTQS